MLTEIKVRERGPATVLTRRDAVRIQEIGPTISASFGEVYGYLGRVGLQPMEPPFIIYHGMPGSSGLPFEIEICAPVSGPVDPPDGWRLRDLPAGLFASIVHVGPYEGVGEAYGQLQAWIAGHGYTVVDPPREVYLSEPGTPAAKIRTVVEMPVSNAPVASHGG